jgi:hypothetical protein
LTELIISRTNDNKVNNHTAGKKKKPAAGRGRSIDPLVGAVGKRK